VCVSWRGAAEKKPENISVQQPLSPERAHTHTPTIRVSNALTLPLFLSIHIYQITESTKKSFLVDCYLRKSEFSEVSHRRFLFFVVVVVCCPLPSLQKEQRTPLKKKRNTHTETPNTPRSRSQRRGPKGSILKKKGRESPQHNIKKKSPYTQALSLSSLSFYCCSALLLSFCCFFLFCVFFFFKRSYIYITHILLHLHFLLCFLSLFFFLCFREEKRNPLCVILCIATRAQLSL
jgi:hypothetical protein